MINTDNSKVALAITIFLVGFCFWIALIIAYSGEYANFGGAFFAISFIVALVTGFTKEPLKTLLQLANIAQAFLGAISLLLGLLEQQYIEVLNLSIDPSILCLGGLVSIFTSPFINLKINSIFRSDAYIEQ